jgi:hypothetical protein
MRKPLKSSLDTKGAVSAEAAIASAAVILLFSVFLSLTGYFITAAKARDYISSWLEEGTKVMHATGIHVPLVLKTGAGDIPMIKNLRASGIAYDGSLRVLAKYDYCSVFGDIGGTVSATGTLWMGDGKSLSDIPCVWRKAPAARGRAIEEIFGGNLPEFFPVADIYNEKASMVTSIVSMDTTLDVYETGFEIYTVMLEKASELADFKGSSTSGTTIIGEEIKYRKLLIVIPCNPLSSVQDEWLWKALDQISNNGIAAEVKRFQTAE